MSHPKVEYNQSVVYDFENFMDPIKIDLNSAINGTPLSQNEAGSLYSLLSNSPEGPEKIYRHEGKKHWDGKDNNRVAHQVGDRFVTLNSSILIVDGKFYLFKKANNKKIGEGQNGAAYLLTHEVTLNHQQKIASVSELEAPIVHKISKIDSNSDDMDEFNALSKASLSGHSTILPNDVLSAVDKKAIKTITKNLTQTTSRTYMTYHEGERLSDYLKNNPNLTFNEKMEIGSAIIDALEILHSKNVVHGDISLDNILINKTDAGYVAHFVDIERPYSGFIGDKPSGSISQVAYGSEESLSDIGKFSPRRDIVALGLVYYEMFVQDGTTTRPLPWVLGFSNNTQHYIQGINKECSDNGKYQFVPFGSDNIQADTPEQQQACYELIHNMTTPFERMTELGREPRKKTSEIKDWFKNHNNQEQQLDSLIEDDITISPASQQPASTYTSFRDLDKDNPSQKTKPSSNKSGILKALPLIGLAVAVTAVGIFVAAVTIGGLGLAAAGIFTAGVTAIGVGAGLVVGTALGMNFGKGVEKAPSKTTAPDITEENIIDDTINPVSGMGMNGVMSTLNTNKESTADIPVKNMPTQNQQPPTTMHSKPQNPYVQTGKPENVIPDINTTLTFGISGYTSE